MTAMKNITLPDCDLARLVMLRGMVKSVRCWMDGFAAAGGNKPPDEQVHWMLMVLFDEAIAAAKKRGTKDKQG